MSGGEICGTVTAQNGGGGYSSNAAANRFTMSGGFIRNNSALAGGGVYITNGEFTMTGGEISGNTAPDRGGGVYINDSAAIFNMSGGSITGNNNTGSGYGGGGVYMNGGDFTMSGTARIAGNTAGSGNGNGVYINFPPGSFTMSGGAVINADNNVYLAQNGGIGKTITINSALTGATPVAVIKPALTVLGTQILDGTAVAANYHKFALDPSVSGSIGADGRLAP
jgi:hypothetical protein